MYYQYDVFILNNKGEKKTVTVIDDITLENMYPRREGLYITNHYRGGRVDIEYYDGIKDWEMKYENVETV